MDYLNEDHFEEHGLFVYQALEKIFVSRLPDVDPQYQTELCFEKDQLVAVDLILPSGSSRSGPFLRLADGSGWLFEFRDSVCVMQSLPVMTNMLWVMYVDNSPNGHALRRHPVDRDDLILKPDMFYKPMRKLYCDKKVFSLDTGVSFYRVQGTHGWLFDRRIVKEEGNSEGRIISSMLLPENHIKMGPFAFRSLGRMTVRNRTDLSLESETSTVIESDQIVIVDIIRESLDDTKGGSFLRMIDGSGWLYLGTNDDKLLEEVPMETGQWKLKVVSSIPIGLYRQPIDRKDMESDKNVLLNKNDKIECAQRIKGANGVTFYRIKGTNKFIFDNRSGQPIMQVIKPGKGENNSCGNGNGQGGTQGWTPDFVRGVASLVKGAEEVAFDEVNKVLTYRIDSAGGSMIMVFYGTRNAGIALKRPHRGRTQYLKRSCNPSDLSKILRNPQDQMDEYCPDEVDEAGSTEGSTCTRSLGSIVFVKDEDQESGEIQHLEDEDDVRRQLIACDEEIQMLKHERQDLLKSLKAFDEARASEERETVERQEKRERERVEAAQKLKAEQVKKDQISQGRTCSQCGRVFKNAQAQHKHFRAVHSLLCPGCGESFISHLDLDMHQDAFCHY